VRIGYALWYRRCYQYRIERGRLLISRGVIQKEEALLPLMPLTELYIRRSWVDLLFGLSNVYIAVILERAQKIGEVRGLRHKDALRVRDEILRVIEVQQQLPPTPQVMARTRVPVVLPKPLPQVREGTRDEDSRQQRLVPVRALSLAMPRVGSAGLAVVHRDDK
jgi:hypothetical protein